MVAKNILHAHYVAKLRRFLLGITNFLSITNNTSAFLLQRRNAPLFFVTYVVFACYSSYFKNHFLAIVHFYHSFCMRKYRSIYTAHQLERIKIIFYCRIIINGATFTHIFVNHFAKVSQLLQKIFVVLHYTLPLSHFLLFIFQVIPHSSLIYFVPTQILINIATINHMNESWHHSHSLTAPLPVPSTALYTKKIYSIKQSTHFAHKILITMPCA